MEAAHRWRHHPGHRRLLDLPALDHEDMPENTMADAERWAAGIRGPAYAIDDETALRVTDGTVDLVSEGNWKLFSS